jgi:putative transposase
VDPGGALGTDPASHSRWDQKFTDRFDDVFRSDGMEVVRTPYRQPQANGVAERFVRTARSECFDRLMILNQQHLERTVAVFVDHTTGTGPTERCRSRLCVARTASCFRISMLPSGVIG